MFLRNVLAGVLILFVSFCYIWEPEPLKTTVLNECATRCVFFIFLISLICLLLFLPKRKTFVDPSDKAILITGCDSGFGHGLAQKLDALGYTVFAGCLAPDREGAQSLKEATSDKLHIVQLDVTDDWQTKCALKYVKQHLGDKVMWAVVNNAGVAIFTEIEWCSVTQFERIMDVNVFGIVRVTKLFLPLVRQAQGRIINVASLAGRFTLPAFAAYSMSKKACIAFSDALRQEMMKFKVNVITVEPSLYKTPICQTNVLIDQNRKSWAETPTEVKQVYGEEYFDAFLNNIQTQMQRARGNVEEVVDQMVEAVSVTEPRHRYVPYWLSNVRATILTMLPTHVQDKFFAASYLRDIKKDKKKET